MFDFVRRPGAAPILAGAMSPHGWRRRDLLAKALGLGAGAGASTFGVVHASGANALKLSFRGHGFVHRWSKDAQHEFTPEPDTDLKSWRDMITLNVHDTVHQGEQLADLANQATACTGPPPGR